VWARGGSCSSPIVRLETNEAPTVAIAMFGWTLEVVVESDAGAECEESGGDPSAQPVKAAGGVRRAGLEGVEKIDPIRWWIQTARGRHRARWMGAARLAG
jgi:hypothetical protein